MPLLLLPEASFFCALSRSQGACNRLRLRSVPGDTMLRWNPWMRIWMLSKSKNWFGRQFHVFKPLYVSIFWWVWKLSRAKSWFGRWIHVFKLFYWSSWVVKADLDHCFTFLSCFMLVSSDEFGSSWRLKTDFDNTMTFLSRFMEAIEG